MFRRIFFYIQETFYLLKTNLKQPVFCFFFYVRELTDRRAIMRKLQEGGSPMLRLSTPVQTTLLDVHTHTRTHACMHARTHARTHVHTHTHTVPACWLLYRVNCLFSICTPCRCWQMHTHTRTHTHRATGNCATCGQHFTSVTVCWFLPTSLFHSNKHKHTHTHKKNPINMYRYICTKYHYLMKMTVFYF